MSSSSFVASSLADFVRTAIWFARQKGINLTHTGFNSADGNCIPESVIHNINARTEFPETIHVCPAILRQECIQEALKVTRKFGLFESMTDKQFNEGWTKVSTDWNVPVFGDAFPLVVAHYVKKDILVISVAGITCKFDVYPGELFGSAVDSLHPIVLCYNGNHYESLLPADDASMEASINARDLILTAGCVTVPQVVPQNVTQDSGYGNSLPPTAASPPKRLQNQRQSSSTQAPRKRQTVPNQTVISSTDIVLSPVVTPRKMTDKERTQKHRLKLQMKKAKINDCVIESVLCGNVTEEQIAELNGTLPKTICKAFSKWLEIVSEFRVAKHTAPESERKQKHRRSDNQYYARLKKSKPEIWERKRLRQALINAKHYLIRRQSPEFRERNRLSVKKRLENPEAKERNRLSVKKRLENPEAKERNRLNVRKRLETPEAKERNRKHARKSMDKRLKSPAFCRRNKMLAQESRRLRFQNFRQRQSRTSFNTEISSAWFTMINDHCLQFVCTSCDQLHYRNSVMEVPVDLYDKLSENDVLLPALSNNTSVENKEWICRNCFRYLSKKKVPPESRINGFEFEELHESIEGLTFAEEKCLSTNTIFQCIMEKGVGSQYATKGNIINVPSDSVVTVQSIPRKLQKKEVIGIDFKRRLADEKSYFKKWVRPPRLFEAAEYLVTTPLYREKKITLNENWSKDVLNEEDRFLVPNEEESENHIEADADADHEASDDNLLNSDTVTMDFDTEPDRYFKIAPSEGKDPVSLWKGEAVEEGGFPTVWCGQMRAKKRLVPVTKNQIYKAETRNRHRQFRRNGACILFKAVELIISRASSTARFALRQKKGVSKTLTAGDVIKDGLQSISKLNQGYSFQNNLRGSPAFYSAMQRDLMAFIRQLGAATWFVSLSMPEHLWPDLLRILYSSAHPNEQDLSDAELLALPIKERFKLVKDDPVSVVRHFHRKTHYLFNHVLKNRFGPIGNVTDFTGVTESQFRGSLHTHTLFLVKDAPLIDVASDHEVCQFIDSVISVSETLPDIPGIHLTEEDRQLPNRYQLHAHRKTCKKGKMNCRYDFPKPPMPKTMILRPVELDDEEKKSAKELMKEIKSLLESEELKRRSQLTAPWTFTEFLTKLANKIGRSVSLECYLKTISSTLVRTTVFFARKPSEVWLNPYNPLILYLWRANMDIQFVTSIYELIKYITSYMSKRNKGLSETMKNAANEIKKPDHCSELDQLKKMNDAFIRSREISIQEGVQAILELPSKYSTRKVEWVNVNAPEERAGVLKPWGELKKLAPECTDLTSGNHLKRYTLRPDELSSYCLADWFSRFVLVSQNKTEDDVPNDDEVSDAVTPAKKGKSNVFQLQNNQKVRMIANPANFRVIRYPRFSVVEKPEDFFRSQLMLFYPYRSEDELRLGFLSYREAYASVKDDVDRKRREYEPLSSGKMDEALQQVLSEEPVADKQTLERQTAVRVAPNVTHFDDESLLMGSKTVANEMSIIEAGQVMVPQSVSDAEFFQKVASLNDEQQEAFYSILAYARQKEFDPTLSSYFPFISGGAGSGKSFLEVCVYYALVRLYREDGRHIDFDPEKPVVAISAYCGTAARNVCGTTLHSLLGLSFGIGPPTVEKIAETKLTAYRSKLVNLKVLLIDEISFVGANFLYCIDQRLKKIMQSPKPFGGVFVAKFGDLYQLKPVNDRWIFQQPYSLNMPTLNFVESMWSNVELFELKKVMRQENTSWAELLNRIRDGSQTHDDLIRVNRLVGNALPPLTHRACRLLKNAAIYNQQMVSMNEEQETEYSIAVDRVQESDEFGIPQEIIDGLLSHASSLNRKDTRYLDWKLVLVIGQKYMINCNMMPHEDGLLNGTVGILKHYSKSNGRIEVLWIDFQDKLIGKAARRKFMTEFPYASFLDNVKRGWTPIRRSVNSFPVRAETYLDRSYFHIERRQFQVEHAQGVTIHKFQGKTEDYLSLDFSISRPQDKVHGLVYVGLSRCRTEQGNSLVYPVTRDDIKVEEYVSKEMSRLRKKPFTSHVLIPAKRAANLKVLFHNVQSLRKHFHLIRNSILYKGCQLMVFCETFLNRLDSSSDYCLPHYNLNRFDYSRAEHGHSSHTGMCVYSDALATNSVIRTRIMECVQFVAVEISEVDILFVHRRPSETSLTSFVSSLRAILNEWDVDIVLGDFNVAIQQDGKSLSAMLANRGYHNLTPQFTTKTYTDIDAVYSKVPLFVTTLQTVFSHHLPIYIELQL